MSRSADRDPAGVASAEHEGGFTLIEVLVSLGIITVVMTALLPQLIVGIKATGTSSLVTQAKGVAQGQLERMRNLPYHVAPAAGDYRDVLDYYFRNLTPPTTAPTCAPGGPYAVPQASWTGYVTGTARCDYEPSSGAMYRYVVPTTQGFTVVVDTQFLSNANPPQPVTPYSGYNTQTTGKDSPAATQIGVTVTVLYSDKQTLRPVTTYTQIADQPTATIRLKLTADATAVDIGSVTATNGAVSLTGGLLNLAGSLTYASNAAANLAAASGGLATGEQASGASASLAAPPAQTATTQLGSAGSLSGGCVLACWGATQLDLPAMSADAGLPNVGTATAPMQSLLTSNTNAGLSFGNGAATDYRPSLGLSSPLVRLDPQAGASSTGVTSSCHPGNTGAPAYVGSSGFLRSTSTTASPDPSAAEACAVSRASTISLFPTSFAPRGVVQIELQEASAHCVVSGVAHSPTVSYDYRAVVRYHDGGGGDDAYVQAAVITPAATTDPLAGVDLTSVAVGGGHKLGDYIASWSSLLANSLTPTSANGAAAVRLPGVVKLTSQPVRGTDQTTAADGTVTAAVVDPASAVSFSAGVVGCSAQDAR